MRISAASGKHPVGFAWLLNAYVQWEKLDEAKAALTKHNMKGGWGSTRYDPPRFSKMMRRPCAPGGGGRHGRRG